MPTIDWTSGHTGQYSVTKVYDGDTITIRTPINTTVSLRLVGVNTPELNASSQAEKQRALAARDYLRRLILNKDVIITYEKSERTLDGIARGPFCRPLAYIFIREGDRNIFVNLEIVWAGHGEKYFKYDFAYQAFFRLDRASAQSRINALMLTPPVQQSPTHKYWIPAMWGHLKQSQRIGSLPDSATPWRDGK